MQSIRDKLSIRNLLSVSFAFYLLSGATSAIHYIFYPAVSRFITVGDYGQVQFLVSMFSQLAIVSVVLNILAVIISIRQRDAQLQQRAINILNYVTQLFTIIVAVIGTASLIALHRHLSLDNPLAIIFIGAALVANVPYTIIIGQLQGNGRFFASGVVSLSAAVIKLALGVVAAILQLGTAGIIASIFISLVAAWLIGVAAMGRTHNILSSKSSKKHPLRLSSIKELHFLSSYAASATITILTLTLLSTIDSIISRIVLDNTSAGQYASIATVSKIILSIATPIMWLALPPAVKGDIKRIVKLLGVVAATGVSAAIAIIVTPKFFTATLIGVDPGIYVSYAVIASLSMSTYAIAYLSASSLVCMGSTRRAAIINLLALCVFGLCVIFIPIQPLFYRSLICQLIAGVFICVSTIYYILRRPAVSPPSF